MISRAPAKVRQELLGHWETANIAGFGHDRRQRKAAPGWKGLYSVAQLVELTGDRLIEVGDLLSERDHLAHEAADLYCKGGLTALQPDAGSGGLEQDRHALPVEVAMAGSMQEVAQGRRLGCSHRGGGGIGAQQDLRGVASEIREHLQQFREGKIHGRMESVEEHGAIVNQLGAEARELTQASQVAAGGHDQ